MHLRILWYTASLTKPIKTYQNPPKIHPKKKQKKTKAVTEKVQKDDAVCSCCFKYNCVRRKRDLRMTTWPDACLVSRITHPPITTRAAQELASPTPLALPLAAED